VKRRVILFALLVSGSAALFLLQRSVATAPVTPRPLLYLLADSERDAERIPLALTRLSDAEEIQAGERLAQEEGLVPRPRNAANLDITEYLNKVGEAVASHVQRRAIPYHFYLAEDDNWVNACALPGGYIIVGRGLLQLLESEDELAAVLGHEITHVDDRHAIERLQYELASRKLGLEGVYQLGRPVVEIFKAGYSKEQELEADRGGLELAVEEGYSPAGVLNLMQRFEKLEADSQQRAPGSPIGEIAQLPLGALQEYFRSHPPASDRLAALEIEIRARNWNESAPVRPLAIQKDF
jgi:beta-barrel assembly-enhancing protease